MGTDASNMVIQGGKTEGYLCAVPKPDLSFTLETAPMSSRKLCKSVTLTAVLKQLHSHNPDTASGWGRAETD